MCDSNLEILVICRVYLIFDVLFEVEASVVSLVSQSPHQAAQTATDSPSSLLLDSYSADLHFFAFYSMFFCQLSVNGA